MMNQLLLNICIYTNVYILYASMYNIYCTSLWTSHPKKLKWLQSNHATLHFYPPQTQAMMGLSDMDHMVAEAVTSEQAGRIGVGP